MTDAPAVAKKKAGPIQTLFTLAILGGGAYYLFGGGIESGVANDAVKQYEMVKTGTDKIQTCVRAGLVVAAYVQAKDNAQFQKWQAIERADCAAAGVPK